MLRALTSFFCTTLPLATLGCLISLTAKAQIAADGTTLTTVNQNGNNFTIEQGDRLGDNLFHSFNEFSVPTLGSASFNNPTDIVNIFSRITGNNISDIDGLISANGAANLFLINPNGIIFGENASLNFGGSFFASTADSLLFEDNIEFSATNPTAPPLLTINMPMGLNFGNNPGEIVNRSVVKNSAGDSVGLEVAPGKNLTLVGGDINFETGNTTARGGNIQLGGLSAAGIVGINEDGSLNFAEDLAQADITLSNAADVDVFGTGDGSITINARNLNLEAGNLGRSFIRGGITADSTSAAAQAGDITINATDNVSVDNSLIVNQVLSEAEGNSGDVNISTDSLTLTNGAVIGAVTDGRGNAGAIVINATDTMALDGTNPQGDRISRIASQVNPTGIGDAKGIEINTANLFLTNDAQISSGVLGKGNGGLVLINAAEKLSLNKSTILNNLEADATGKAGDIEITTTNLNLINGSEIEAVTRGIGDAGQISLDVAANISVEGGGIFSNVEGEKSQGNAGGIEIDTANLALTNGADLSASTRGRGNAGAIVINATDTIALNGTNPQGDRISRIASQVNPTGIGDAKGIEINTANLFLTNGAQISGGVVGTGAGGLVSINAADKLSLNSSDILTNLEADATGKAGDIDITTTNLNLTNDSQIAASTRGIGDAGQISLDVGETISAKGGGILSTVAGKNSQGNAGGIEINTKNLSLTNGAQITSGVVGTGTGGLVSINVTDEISLDDGFILTNLEADATGKAGNIEITTTNLNLTNGSEIDAVTRGIGDAGQISLDVAETISVKGRGDLNIPSFSCGISF